MNEKIMLSSRAVLNNPHCGIRRTLAIVTFHFVSKYSGYENTWQFWRVTPPRTGHVIVEKDMKDNKLASLTVYIIFHIDIVTCKVTIFTTESLGLISFPCFCSSRTLYFYCLFYEAAVIILIQRQPLWILLQYNFLKMAWVMDAAWTDLEQCNFYKQ